MNYKELVETEANAPAVGTIIFPATLSGLVVWLDAGDLSSIYQDSTFLTPAVADSVVGALRDRISTNHVIQTSPTSKPILKVSIQNSRHVVRFDGTDDQLSKSSFQDFGDAYTVFAVAKYSSAGDTSQAILDVAISGSSGSGFSLYHESGAIWRVRDATTNRSVTGANCRDNVFRIFRGVVSTTLSQFWINNASVGTIAYTAPNPNTLNSLVIGRLAGNVGYSFNGDLAELMIYSRNLTAQEQTDIETYLNAKWAVY